MTTSPLHIPSSPLLTRFLTRTRTHALRLLPPTQRDSPPTPLPAPNPFIPTYNEESGCWAPPRFSRRRQRMLLKEAEREGVREWMPIGVGERRAKEERTPVVMEAEAEKDAEAVVQEAPVRDGEGGETKLEAEVPGTSTVVELPPLPTSPPNASAAASIASLTPPPSPTDPPPRRIRTPPIPLPLLSPDQPFQWLGLPPAKIAHSTVYGRRVADKEQWFRGHKWQREKEEREKEVGDRLGTMGDRVKDWREARVNDKQAKRSKSGLPF